MRIYLPATLLDLASADGIAPRVAHAATPALLTVLDDADSEAAELAALLQAADDSVRLVAGAPGAPRRRLVIAADVHDAHVTPAPEEGPPSAVLAPHVPWTSVVSFHVDDADDPQVPGAVGAAAAGEEGAAERAAELDLLWYDVSERDVLQAQSGDA